MALKHVRQDIGEVNRRATVQDIAARGSVALKRTNQTPDRAAEFAAAAKASAAADPVDFSAAQQTTLAGPAAATAGRAQEFASAANAASAASDARQTGAFNTFFDALGQDVVSGNKLLDTQEADAIQAAQDAAAARAARGSGGGDFALPDSGHVPLDSGQVTLSSLLDTLDSSPVVRPLTGERQPLQAVLGQIPESLQPSVVDSALNNQDAFVAADELMLQLYERGATWGEAVGYARALLRQMTDVAPPSSDSGLFAAPDPSAPDEVESQILGLSALWEQLFLRSGGNFRFEPGFVSPERRRSGAPTPQRNIFSPEQSRAAQRPAPRQGPGPTRPVG